MALTLALGVPQVLVSAAIVAVAPPSYFLPDVNGLLLPASATHYTVEWDQVNVPALSSVDIAVELLSGGVWSFDAAGNGACGGSVTPRNGIPTTQILIVGSSLGPTDPNGQLLFTYQAIRVTCRKISAWLLPFLRITVS